MVAWDCVETCFRMMLKGFELSTPDQLESHETLNPLLCPSCFSVVWSCLVHSLTSQKAIPTYLARTGLAALPGLEKRDLCWLDPLSCPSPVRPTVFAPIPTAPIPRWLAAWLPLGDGLGAGVWVKVQVTAVQTCLISGI